MTILFLSYWGINDGLTQSTVLPHVSILARQQNVDKVLLLTIERGDYTTVFIPEKVRHLPLISKVKSGVLLNKTFDFLLFPKQIEELGKREKIDLMICRSSLAGALGYLVYKKTGIPFIVESFEPHALYMAESGVWRKWGIRYRLQTYWEKMQKEHARLLLPVSENYKSVLLRDGIQSSKIRVLPCCVDTAKFKFNEFDRLKVRKKYGIDENDLVGVYVGKFGGMYMEKEALLVFRETLKHVQGNSLFLITPNSEEEIRAWMEELGEFASTAVVILHVQHDDVPMYLSASDFAFATYKPSYSKQFLSPVKVGEYWANGLPVMISKGIGDDAEIVEREGCGAVFDVNNMLPSVSGLKRIVERGRAEYTAWISGYARKYRSMEFVENTYKAIV